MTFYKVARAILGPLFKIFFRIQVYGSENKDLDGKMIICSNHIHNLDPFVLSIVFKRQIHWMAKKQIFDNKFLGYLANKVGAFPVDREEADLSTIKKSLKVLKDDKVLGMFPEGTRVKEIDLSMAKAGVTLIGLKSKAPILPVFIDSSYKLFSKVKVYIGKPIDLVELYGDKLPKEEYLPASQNVLKAIYSLKEKGDI